ncbi:MAG: SDR family oxidoreductase [Candidatus Hydrogenedentes bacterium]|nr:SDR family oxidoreductase [Candidatus Hydrogenedentota bacterium]
MSGASPLAGKTALVTGAAKRIGHAVALELARNGVNVVVHYRHSSEYALETADAIRATGVRTWTLSADLADPDAAAGLMSRAVKTAGPIDILVNSASAFPEDTLRDFSLDRLRQSIAVNAFAPLVLSRRFASQDREGAIINFLDARMNDYDRGHVSYQLAKQMLASLTGMMANEFAPAIRVNAVAPGLVLPPEGKDDAYLHSLAHTNPLNAVGTVAEVTDAVLFLLRSPFVTGQVIYVDGGRHLRSSVHV